VAHAASSTQISRRNLLRASIGGLLAAAAPSTAFGALRPEEGARALAFNHLHTGETLAVPYWENGRYLPDALSEIDTVLRDFRTGEKIRMDTGVLDFLFRLRTELGSTESFHIISAYRSPRTNARLAAKSRNVAKRSYHTKGMAIDIRLPGRRLRDVRRAALDLKLGGVGYYPRSNFVHIDTGRVRFW
jgi:uncharacterized protein YcbK (DUF882 family)